MATCYAYPKACGPIPHANDFVVDLAVCAKDSRTARLIVMSERRMLRRKVVPIA